MFSALSRIVGGAPDVAWSPAGPQTAAAEWIPAETPTVPEQEIASTSAELPPARWTEELAGDFMAGLEPAGRRMALHVWRAGAAGIHRSALCQRTELMPAELRSAADADGARPAEVPAGTGDDAVPAGGGQQPTAKLLRRSRLRRGGDVPDVRREDGGPAGLRRGAPLMDSRRWALGSANCASVVECTDDNGRPVDPAGLRGGRR